MAIQRDYLQRIIEEFGQALVKMLAKRRKATYDDLRIQIELACRECTGMDYPLAAQVPIKQLLDICKLAESARPHRYLMLGDLLQFDGWLMRENGDEAAAGGRHVRALWMYLAGTQSRYPEIACECEEKVAALAEGLDRKLIPRELKERLVDHFERVGRFAFAERFLFDLTDTNDPAMLKRARSFYEHLVALPDEALEAGAISREEAQRGLARVK